MRVERALGWRRKEVRGSGDDADCLFKPIATHVAVVSAVTPAARWEMRIVGRFKRGREGAEREEESEQDGEAAAHLESMVHEVTSAAEDVL